MESQVDPIDLKNQLDAAGAQPAQPIQPAAPSTPPTGPAAEPVQPVPAQTEVPSLDDLVFKTMPRDGGNFSKVFHPPVAPKPVYMPNQTVPTAPEPVAAKEAHPHITPKPTTPVPPPPTSGDFGNLYGPSPKHTLRNILIALISLLILGGIGFLAYSNGWVKNPFAKKAQQDNTQNSQVAVTKIPDSWRQHYFNSATCNDQNICGDDADPDKDGLTNLDEYQQGTDPNNNDSDNDKISDGDEIHIFGSKPNDAHTSGNLKYDDGKDVQFLWNSAANRKFTSAELQDIANKIKQYGLHEPTIGFLGQSLVTTYTTGIDPNAQPQTTSAQATPKPGALDRDTQRYNTTSKLAFALLKYHDANNSYPDVSNYDDMIAAIRPLISAQAINTTDPTNIDPYVYAYQSVNSGADFKLSYFSETQNQLIVINQAEAQKEYAKDQTVQRDTKRKADLEQLAGVLQLYSNDHADPSQPDQQVFPPAATWKTALEAKYITKVPVDPQTGQDYVYSVSSDNSSFALQATLENPPSGKRGYVCTSEAACGYY